MGRRGRPGRDEPGEGRARGAGGRHQGGGRRDPGSFPEERPGRGAEDEDFAGVRGGRYRDRIDERLERIEQRLDRLEERVERLS